MRMLLVFVALAGLALIAFKMITRGAPQPQLSTILNAPGATVSKLSFHGGSAGTIAIVVGVGILVVILARGALSK